METSKTFRKRNAILHCLRSTTSHPSAEALYQLLQKEHPDISLATVYRNLALFKSQGLAVSVQERWLHHRGLHPLRCYQEDRWRQG